MVTKERLEEMIQNLKERVAGQTVNAQWFLNEFDEELMGALLELQERRIYVKGIQPTISDT